MNANPELKPCPFCPKGKGQWRSTDSHFYWVICDRCGAETKGSKTLEEAIKQWNTRTSPAAPVPPADEVEVVGGAGSGKEVQS